MSKTLEIDLRSAEGLKVNRKSVKRKTFCVVKIDEKSRHSNLDESGGSNPTWNYKTEMAINGNVQFIYVQVFYQTSSRRDKKIGEAKIPAADFAGKYSPIGHLNVLSYRLRDEYGDKCGIVNVSIMVKSDSATAATAKDHHGCSSQTTENGLWRPRLEAVAIDGYGGRIVTGVPVWCVFKRP